LADYQLEGNPSEATAGYFAANLLAYFGPKARAVEITRDRSVPTSRYDWTRAWRMPASTVKRPVCGVGAS
jgi:hypothetical protein